MLDATRSPLHPSARETLLAALDAGWADPRRLHREGRQARLLLDRARESLAASLGVRPDELSFHPSGAHALRTGVAGLRHARRRVGSRLITSAVDQAVLLHEAHEADPDSTPLLVDNLGRLSPDTLHEALVAGPPAAAVALQHANGEVGTVQPLEDLFSVCRAAGLPLLVDGTSSLGRLETPQSHDALVGDAATVAGPPLGVLVVRTGTRFDLPGPRWEPEHGREPADPWVPLALAAAEAWQQAVHTRDSEAASARLLVDQIRTAAAGVPDVDVVGDPSDRLPHVVTFSALYVDGESIVDALDRLGIVVASGSACTSSRLEPSHVLAAMGALTHGNVRVTLPLESVSPHRAADVEALCRELPGVITDLRDRLGVSDL
ncbi:putative aminotransferase [Janibacter sp. HTCC2649]|uniref:cysteine desulfurase family protein n=1 Tax=Janibacter sp. HTCC2649 TaxID=313589 RepID=UPI000066ED3E|nr:aminotransferase class V-fold PLP-dependent enzyme [Janibacter sp. HTCC2649]EAP98787.1 putative aminotransferase [Janibacter sp. HTCC2649]